MRQDGERTTMRESEPWELTGEAEFSPEERRERSRKQSVMGVIALVVIGAMVCSTLIGLFI